VISRRCFRRSFGFQTRSCVRIARALQTGLGRNRGQSPSGVKTQSPYNKESRDGFQPEHAFWCIRSPGHESGGRKCYISVEQNLARAKLLLRLPHDHVADCRDARRGCSRRCERRRYRPTGSVADQRQWVEAVPGAHRPYNRCCAAFFARRVEKIWADGLQQLIRHQMLPTRQCHPHRMSSFQLCSEADVRRIVMSSPVHPALLARRRHAMTTIVSASPSQGHLPDSQKHAVVPPLLKKSGLDSASSSIEPVLSVKSDTDSVNLAAECLYH